MIHVPYGLFYTYKKLIYIETFYIYIILKDV